MGIPDIVGSWFGADRLADMAERVAGRSRMAVWQRVMHRLPVLGPTEARGYIRARSVLTIQEETDRLIAQEGAKVAKARERIIAAATDGLIQTILAQVEQRRLETSTRRAA